MPSGPSLEALRDAQLAYAARGWRTFLVRPTTKLPSYKGWQTAATTDPAIIRSVRSARCSESLSSIGLTLGYTAPLDGSRPRFLLALDEDQPGGLDAWCVGHGAPPLSAMPTWTQNSGRGSHRLYTVSPDRDHLTDMIRNGAIIKGALDIKAAGGFIVLAPSLHSSGREYTVVDDREPSELPDWAFYALTSLPAARRAARHALRPDLAEPNQSQLATPIATRVTRGVAFAASAPIATKGERGHDRAFRVAVVLRRCLVLPANEVLRILTDVYSPRCSPPWADHEFGELMHKVESADADASDAWAAWLPIDRDRLVAASKVKLDDHTTFY
jgi:hypothetical protein